MEAVTAKLDQPFPCNAVVEEGGAWPLLDYHLPILRPAGLRLGK